MERRLAAILAADVVAYSRLIRADEEGTISALRALRQELIDPKIEAHRGRIVKLMGDGILVEFASVVDAVACSAEVQQGMAERNTSTLEAQQIVFRVGINLGDIVIDGDDIQGDGVNLAARLEALSEPGGICISDAVHEQVRDRLDLRFEDYGEQEVKNIDRPVQIWKWSVADPTTTPNSYATAVASLAPKVSTLPLPEKPSIAVLPFDNMSGDPEQEYFSDGITEDIITTLSKISKLFVIARNSTFVYKGKAVDVKQVGREQGVRYVLEGSVRSGGDRMRITAQLIEAATGHHLWAERYDREIGDIFAVQDDVTKEIVSALQIELTEGEQARLAARGTENLEAWQLTYEARTLVHEHHQDSVQKSLGLLEKAMGRDEDYALAWGVLAEAHWSQALNRGWSASRDTSLELALEASDQATALDPTNAGIMAMRAVILASCLRFHEALPLAEEALQSAHSEANALAIGAIALRVCGKPETAIEYIKKAIRHCPIYPAWYLDQMAHCYWMLKQYDQTIAIAQTAIESDPQFSYPYGVLALTYAETGRQQMADDSVKEMLRIDPSFSADAWIKGLPYADPDMQARQVAAFRKAGMPD